MKIKTIDLLPPQTRILLKEEMRRKLFSDKISVAQRLGISRKTINNWIRGDFRPSLEQLQKMYIDTNKEEFIKNIQAIGLEKSKFNFVLQNTVNLEDLSWLLGIVEGDRAGEANKEIGLTNEDEELIKNFILTVEMLNINKENLRMKIQTTKNVKINKKEFSRKFGIPIKRITVSESEIPRKKPVIQILLTSKIFAFMFQNLKRVMNNTSKINSDIKRKFIKGFCDAEGSVNSRKFTIEIKQKNSEEGRKRIFLINNMLTSLNIQNKINGPNCEDMLIIRLAGGKRNLENTRRFSNLIGFSNSEKQEKLNKILTNTMLSAGHMA